MEGHDNISTSSIEQLLTKENIHKPHCPPLIDAARKGEYDTVKTLIKAGANVNQHYSDNMYTALIWSAFHGYESVVRLLLNYGANINQGDNRGFTALMAAAQNGYESTVRLLLDKGADINLAMITESSYTALYLAALSCEQSTTKLLLDRGAMISDNLMTTMMRISTITHYQKIKTLIEQAKRTEATHLAAEVASPGIT